MGASSLSLLLSPPFLPRTHLRSTSQISPYFILPIPIRLSSLTFTSTRSIIPFASTQYSKDPLSFDEGAGVDDDTNGYLNHLSLEYNSVWDTKPSWCQPWSIAMSGVSAIGLSWLFFHSTIFTAVVTLLISAWWYIFLYSYPKEYSKTIAERRKNVGNGVEDAYGITENN